MTQPVAAKVTRARPAQNLYGQKMGAKGMRTRAQYIRATEQLLERRTLRDLTVAEIAHEAAAAPTTFYAYFADVTEAVLAAVNETERTSDEMEAIFAREWTSETSYQNAKDLVEAYCAFWDKHFWVLRTRNLAADEGDRRFMKARHDATLKLTTYLQERIAAVHPKTDAVSISHVMLMMMERIPVITRRPYRRRRSRKHLIEAAAFFIGCALNSPGPLPLADRNGQDSDDGDEA